MKGLENKKLVLIILFIILLVSGFLIKKGVNTFFDSAVVGNKEVSKSVKDNEEKEIYKKEKDKKPNDIKKDTKDKQQIDDKDYDYTVDTSIKLDIPEEIMNYVPKKEFVENLKGFLKDNMLMTENTKVTNDGVITIDYMKKTVSFVISINNSRETNVTVVIKDRSKISFLYK